MEDPEMLNLSTRKCLIAGLLIVFAAPASAQFLEINRIVRLDVLRAVGLTGLSFDPACADPWDGDEVAVTCT